jgi:hypothetical protein
MKLHQPRASPEGIVANLCEFGKRNSASPMQSLNAPMPITVSVFGSCSFINPEHPERHHHQLL